MNTEGAISYELGKHTEIAWINPNNGRKPQITTLKGETEEILQQKLLKQLSAEGRYHIGANYKDGTGHIITCHRMKTGNLFFYDAQKGYFVELRNFLESATDIELLKVDRLHFNIDIVSGVLELL